MNFHDASIKGLMTFIWFMTGWNCPRDFWMALSISISTSTSISISISESKSISISVSISISMSLSVSIYLYLNLNTESHTVNPSNTWSMHAGTSQIQYTKIIMANEMLYAYVCLCMLMYADHPALQAKQTTDVAPFSELCTGSLASSSTGTTWPRVQSLP